METNFVSATQPGHQDPQEGDAFPDTYHVPKHFLRFRQALLKQLQL